jgi:hypothetical protein
MRRSLSHPPAAAVALALLAAPIAGFLIVRPDRPPERDQPARTTRSPAASRPHWRVSVQATRTPQSIARPELAAARAGARIFLSAYLARLRGRGSVRAITHAAPELLRELTRHPVRVTPAQDRMRPRVLRLSVARAGGSVRAVAILQDSGGPPYPLLLYLERRASVWTVTRLGDV